VTDNNAKTDGFYFYFGIDSHLLSDVAKNKYVISHTLKTEVPLMTWQQRADRRDKNVRPSRCDIKIKDEIFPMVG
jgi:hypothetical protein